MALPARIADDVQLFAELARHATTVVYKGYQRAEGRFVLVKMLRPARAYDEALAARFEEEARLLARVQHPNVVATYDFGRADGHPYLVAEYVDGMDAAACLAAHGPLPLELALFVLRETAHGLAAAHAQGILHRDLKPANLLLAHDGAVKLTDFGMASLLEEAAPEVRGTPGYLAPEQVLGQPPTPAADLFALGATFAELLTAQPAFSGDEAGAVLHAVLHHDPMPFLEATTPLPDAVRRVCDHLLAKDPAARYAHAADLLADLDALGKLPGAADLAAYLQDPAAYRRPAPRQPATALRPAATPAPPARALLPSRWVQGAFVAVAAIIFFVLGYSSLAGRQAPPPGDAEATPAPLALTDSMDAPADTLVAEVAPPPAPVAPPRARPAGFGRLSVTAEPWAEIFIDGQPIGKTPLAEPIVLAAGEHRVELRHPEFPAYQTTLRVVPGQQAAVETSLWDLVGAIDVQVHPWAEVLIDGELRDTTPLDRPLVVRPGTHRLTLRHRDLGTYEETLYVEAGTAQTLRYNLIELLPQ